MASAHLPAIYLELLLIENAGRIEVAHTGLDVRHFLERLTILARCEGILDGHVAALKARLRVHH